MKNMDAKELLESNLISDPVKRFTTELLEVFEERNTHQLLNKQTAELGLIILNALPGLKKTENKWAAIEPIVYNDERYKRLSEFVTEEGWKSKGLNDLLIYFFGAEKARYVEYALEQMRFQMYQTGYTRRSFRAPQNRQLYFINQLNFFVNAIPQVYLHEGYPDYTRQYYDLSVAEQVRYSNFFNQNSLFRLWSAAIDLENKEVFQQMEDIIFNKDDFGKVTRDLIKALLNSEKKEAWQLVEKLLLAAQRQEGLRQTVLEALDETSIGALKYLIKVIITHKLSRFSSVVRAVDVWAGLAWESERENTVKTFLEKAHDYLESPDKISGAVKSDNNADVYMGLWAQGVFDVEKTAPFLHALYEAGNSEKRSLALKFAVETKHYELSLPLFSQALNDHEMLVLAWALYGINDLLGERSEDYDNHLDFPELFDKLHNLVQRVDTKEKTYEGKIFSWTKISFNRNEALAAMIELINDNQTRLDIVLGYFDQMNVELREKLTRHILQGYAAYSWQESEEKPPLTNFQHDFAIRILSDRGEFIVRAAFQALAKAAFSAGEMQILQNLLKRKGAHFRGQIIGLLLKQDDQLLAKTTAQILTIGDGEQRLAGLDILLQLKKAGRLKAETSRIVEEFKNRKNISQKEEILLSQLTDSDDNNQNYSAENGYGLFNPERSISPIVTPQIKPDNFYEKRVAAHAFGFSVSVDEIKKAIANLADIYLQNKDFEYEAEAYNNTSQTLLLGNVFRNKKYNHKFETPQEQYLEYPLPEVWEKWFGESGLDPADLFLIHLAVDFEDDREEERKNLVDNFIPSSKKLMPKEFTKRHYYYNPLNEIIDALRLVHPFAEKDEFMLGGCVRLFSSLGDSILKGKEETKGYYSRNSGNGWQSSQDLNIFYEGINDFEIADKLIKDLWNLSSWRQFSGREENIQSSFPPLIIFCRAFELEIINEDEMLRGLTTPENVRMLSSKTLRKNDFDYFSRFPFLESMFGKVREHILNIELKRGDSATSVTSMASNLQAIYGINRFAEILIGLGKTTLNRGYSYYNGGERNKQSLFSQLLKNSFPLETDAQNEFDALIKKAKISEVKLIEAAVYAPQWQKFVSSYLGWKGLDSAIWWMHAHTKNSDYREQNSESESEIAKYSRVDLQDFKDGAVDKEWFVATSKEIGKARWTMVYDAAKYISDGNGHRRARLYADVISGNTKLKEITQKVKDKRDQDYLRMYGLVPLNKANVEKDVLSRYAYLQKFKKESKQFGAQKQTSEALAIRIAMENLARNAGYADPMRLTWAMETKQVQAVLSEETEVQIAGILIKLSINEEGQADVVAFKDGNQLKSVPAKHKKDKKVLELNEHKKTLKEQFSRSRQGLEEAMVRGDKFTLSEMENLFSHPVISKHLEKLVFDSGKAHGFYKNGTLVSPNGTETKLVKADEIRIAHCVDLYESKEWSDYQRYCFDHELKQPFKQIFRELYLPTEDELKEKSVSRRYAGHQVQPRQTAALLKTRGWKADYEEGLQKVFHKEGFTAKMYALADWFSPAEVESPTLETVVFSSLKDFKNVAFENINPRIFSEVMRDIDLVVSVAHAGGVDPEASHSSIEMRSVLLKETLRLFKLDNVTISGSHAKIKGTLGEYSVHLGSAVVHKLPGKYLSVLPVQSQHRGRIFLPFADDDPKSAEVMSKVLLFGRDNEIQDPTILRQLAD
jgi:hypothetical protein